ncbi:MAG: hypothetical protein WAW79_08885 [Steroidobacteraceae bacterium]
MKRHWSFVVCDKRYLYPVVGILMVIGLAAAFKLRDPTQFSRVGGFIIGIGVWISMRYTLREGINRVKDFAKTSPHVQGTTQVNIDYFNQIAFSIGDAQLQVHGFVLVVLGSVVGSYGDLILVRLFPACFA